MGTVRVTGCKLNLHTRNMVRDRLALRLVGGCILGQAQLGGHRGDSDLGYLQGQLQLLGRLRGCPKPMGAMACQLVLELLDQHRLRLHFGQQKRGEGPQFCGVFR